MRPARFVVALAVTACATTPPPAQSPADPGAAVNALARAYWAFQMARYPTWATYLGDRRHDDRLADLSDAAHERDLARVRDLKERLSATPADGLSPQDMITREVLGTTLDDELDGEVCRERLWKVDQLDGYQVTLAELPNYHTITTRKNADDLVARYRAVGPLFDQHLANLRVGLSRGLTAARINVERVVEQLGELLAIPPEKSAYLLAAEQLPASFADADRQAITAALLAAVKESVVPALERYRDFLRGTYLAQARPAVGVSANPDGARCYAFLIRYHTGVRTDAKALHETGLRELAAIHAEMRTIARQVGGPEDLPVFFAALIGRKDQYLGSREALVAHNRALVEKAGAALPKAFGRLPQKPVEVKPIEPFREKDAVAAYYYGAPDDGSRSAVYYVNTYRPETRPLYNMEALAFHEAVPGHHLQIAVAQDTKFLPDFRRHMGSTAYVEGWALYAERLADEMGLYSSPMTRFGMLNFAAWRACRLVVDTGMHAFGWTRKQAMDFLTRNTAIPEAEAVNEVDRYIIWPGQALAYKVGQMEISALRAEAKRRLGDRFELRQFHDRFLATGAVPLPVARRLTERWLDEAAPGSGARATP